MSWSLDTHDWELQVSHGDNTSAYLEGADAVLAAFENSSTSAASPIVYQHDTHNLTVSTLVPHLLAWARSHSLTPVTLAACMGLSDGAMYKTHTAPGVRDASWTCEEPAVAVEEGVP